MLKVCNCQLFHAHTGVAARCSQIGPIIEPCNMVRNALPDDLLAGMSVNASVVEQQNGIDLEEARLLLTEARAAILQVRAALV